MSSTPPDAGRAKLLLERALVAEERVEELERQVRRWRSNVSAALDMDPTTATAALAWIGRAEQAERLLREAIKYVHQQSLSTTDFPPGWVTRAEAQLKAVDILARDQAELMERPSSGDYWAVDGTGSQVMRASHDARA